MAGSLLNKARRDTRKYITNSGWEENITLSTADGLTTIETTGWAPKHWINNDTDGAPINSKNARITLHESELVEQGYPVRNADKEIYLFNHRVSVPDSSGELKEYVIKEWFPSETVGGIVCILGDYESD